MSKNDEKIVCIQEETGKVFLKKEIDLMFLTTTRYKIITEDEINNE